MPPLLPTSVSWETDLRCPLPSGCPLVWPMSAAHETPEETEGLGEGAHRALAQAVFTRVAVDGCSPSPGSQSQRP